MKTIHYSIIMFITLFLVTFFVTRFDDVQKTTVAGKTGVESIPSNLKSTGAMEAMKWYNDQRAYPTGKIPYGWREKAEDHIKKFNLSKSGSVNAVTWTSVGPSNVGGRVRSIAVDPANSNIIYAGSVSGGIWKSTNGGSGWAPISDFVSNMVIGCITIDPLNSNIIYAGTGEGYFNYDALRGIGVLKSTDAGATWTVLNNFVGAGANYYYYFINKIVIRPDNPNILFAAVTNNSEGIWKSTDAGASWSKITTPSTSKFCTDLVLDPNNSNTMYAAFGLFSSDGVYKTTNGGTSWTKLATGFPATTLKYTRISLSISKTNPAVLFASVADSNYYTHGIYKLNTSGTSWVTLTTPYDYTVNVSGTHLGGQGWYNNVITAHPTDTNTVYVGGINLFRTTNGGSLWNRLSDGYSAPYVHVDQHAITIDPNNYSTVYFGCDGGVFKSTTGGNSFNDMNSGFSTIQFYSGAVHPTIAAYFGGTQDNGTLKTTTPTTWQSAFGGDGGDVWINYNSPNIIFTEYVNLTIFKSTDGGSSWNKAMNGIPTGPNYYDGTTDRVDFIAPYTMDPGNPSNLVAGTYKIYRTTNSGTLWTSISGDLTGDGAGSTGAIITAIGIAKSSSVTIYVGTGGSGTSTAKVWVTTNTGTNWTNVTVAPIPNRRVTAIAVDPNNRDSAYVCFSGYGTGHLYFTANRGTSWSNKSGNLPDIPVNAIIIDPVNVSHLFLGTDLGVYESNDGGTTWTQQNSGMANVSVADLDLNNNGYLFAATHGRGMFKTVNAVGIKDENITTPTAFNLEQNFPNPFNPSTLISFSIAEPSYVALKIFDMSGREVVVIEDGELHQGRYERKFDGSTIASGVYFYNLKVSGKNGNHFSQTKKMILVK
ncbi:MAG: T9SS type A sorting domain-containing protein [Ignavibacteriales bacterium]|nr:T9SS type A sorting domain-containing protein [Ignavibacteriales bacterium]